MSRIGAVAFHKVAHQLKGKDLSLFKLLALAAGARGFSSPRLSAGKGNIQHR